MKAFYDAWYRFGSPPWTGSPRAELVELVTSGVLQPGRALDLGCGEGDNAIFLAQHGFVVTALDYAPSAIAKARRKAGAAGVDVDFVVDDLTDLRQVRGSFDLLVDYGTLDDLSLKAREAYVRQVVPLLRPGGRFLLWCFEWDYRRWERLVLAVLPLGQMALAPGEADRRFAGAFEIDRFAGEQDLRGWPRGWAAYLMTKRAVADADVASGTPPDIEEEKAS